MWRLRGPPRLVGVAGWMSGQGWYSVHFETGPIVPQRSLAKSLLNNVIGSVQVKVQIFVMKRSAHDMAFVHEAFIR